MITSPTSKVLTNFSTQCGQSPGANDLPNDSILHMIDAQQGKWRLVQQHESCRVR